MCVEWLHGPRVRGSFCITGLDPNSTHVMASLFLFVCVCVGATLWFFLCYSFVLPLCMVITGPLKIFIYFVKGEMPM